MQVFGIPRIPRSDHPPPLSAVYESDRRSKLRVRSARRPRVDSPGSHQNDDSPRQTTTRAQIPEPKPYRQPKAAASRGANCSNYFA